MLWILAQLIQKLIVEDKCLTTGVYWPTEQNTWHTRFVSIWLSPQVQKHQESIHVFDSLHAIIKSFTNDGFYMKKADMLGTMCLYRN